MKKILSLLLAFSLALSLAACGGSASSAASSTAVSEAASSAAASEEEAAAPLSATEPLRIALPKCDLLAGTRVGAGELELHGNPYISGRHCKFSYQNGQYYLTDIGSSNGTYLNGQMLPRDVPQALKDGDTITIATSVFRVTRQEGGGMR